MKNITILILSWGNSQIRHVLSLFDMLFKLIGEMSYKIQLDQNKSLMDYFNKILTTFLKKTSGILYCLFKNLFQKTF